MTRISPRPLYRSHNMTFRRSICLLLIHSHPHISATETNKTKTNTPHQIRTLHYPRNPLLPLLSPQLPRPRPLRLPRRNTLVQRPSRLLHSRLLGPPIHDAAEPAVEPRPHCKPLLDGGYEGPGFRSGAPVSVLYDESATGMAEGADGELCEDEEERR